MASGSVTTLCFVHGLPGGSTGTTAAETPADARGFPMQPRRSSANFVSHPAELRGQMLAVPDPGKSPAHRGYPGGNRRATTTSW